MKEHSINVLNFLSKKYEYYSETKEYQGNLHIKKKMANFILICN